MASRKGAGKKADVPDSSAIDTEQAEPKKLSKPTIACAGCAGIVVIAAVVVIIAIMTWDPKDARLYEGEPLPENVGYIGRWVSDDTLSMRIDTFALAGDRIACDFAVRNDSDSEVTVHAIGRTIIAQSIASLFNQTKLPLELVADDQPMQVTDEENVMGIASVYGTMALVVPEEADDAPAPQPFTLKPRQTERLRYRPHAHQLLMPASGLRLAAQLDDGREPHAFYFLRQSAGISGWMERGAQKAIQGPR